VTHTSLMLASLKSWSCGQHSSSI